MQNNIILSGRIWGIQDSHTIGDIQYQKANMTIRCSNGKESVITLQFKKFQCPYSDGDDIQLVGNIRSYSKKIDETKNKVNIYVYTYFDVPSQEEIDSWENQFLVEGRICKLGEMLYFENEKNNIHFILANNIVQGQSKLNSYLPCVAWGKLAKQISKLKKNDIIAVQGELRSREYKKKVSESDIEIRVAHELIVTDFQHYNVTEDANEEQL